MADIDRVLNWIFVVSVIVVILLGLVWLGSMFLPYEVSFRNSPESTLVLNCSEEGRLPHSFSPEHPFAGETLVVGIENPANATLRVENATKVALRYWERHSERYAGFSVDYELRAAADQPDILIRVVEQVEGDTTYGVTNLITERHTQPDTTHICIQSDTPRSVLTRSIKHELGHTLGLDHKDDPKRIMKH